MDDPRRAFMQLNQSGKRHVHVCLCGYALHVWEAYAHHHAPIDYVDSVMGLPHQVDTTLPRDVLASIQANNDRVDVAQRYMEPITALQDADLDFPEHIEFAYYAIYNLYLKYVQRAAIDDWLIVNQALSAETNPAHWKTMLIHALQQAQV